MDNKDRPIFTPQEAARINDEVRRERGGAAHTGHQASDPALDTLTENQFTATEAQRRANGGQIERS